MRPDLQPLLQSFTENIHVYSELNKLHNIFDNPSHLPLYFPLESQFILNETLGSDEFSGGGWGGDSALLLM